MVHVTSATSRVTSLLVAMKARRLAGAGLPRQGLLEMTGMLSHARCITFCCLDHASTPIIIANVMLAGPKMMPARATAVAATTMVLLTPGQTCLSLASILA